jgi:hypothetical protein
MASPQEIAVDLADVGELLAAQVDAGLDRDEVLQSLYTSWAQRLSVAARLSPKGKTIVTNALQQGPWSAEHKKDLASIVLGGGATTKAAVRRPTQKVMEFQNFITITTMLKLRDLKLSRASRMSLLAAEARNIGVENADEKTLYRLTQILAYCEGNYDFSQEQVWACMDDLQTFIKSVPRRKELTYLEYYPSSADLLPAELKMHAYKSSELPVTLDIPELATVLGTAKMRGRPSAKRADKEPKWLQNVPEEHRKSVMAALKGATKSDSNTLPDATSMSAASNTPAAAAGMSSAIISHGSYATPAPVADCFRFQAPPSIKPESQKMKAEPTIEHDGTESDHDDKIAGPNTIDDLEKKFLAARSVSRASKPKGNPKKRPAAANAGKPAMKRPAAAAVKAASKAVKKKPSGALKSIPGLKGATWKCVHSKVYHTVRDATYKKTGDHEKAKAAASEACARAKVKFLKGIR